MVSLKGFIVYSSSTHCDYIENVITSVKECLKKKKNNIEPTILGEDIRSTEIYLPQLEEMVKDCDLGIIIFDGFRPNVLFEYGFLKGAKKPLILLKERAAFINIKTLYRDLKGHGLEQDIFKESLNNPPLDINLVLSDISGLHIEPYSKDANESNPDSIQSKIDKELKMLFEKGDLIRDFSLDWIKKNHPEFLDDKIKNILKILALFECVYTDSNFLEKIKPIINFSESNENFCEYLDKLTQLNIIIKGRNYYHLHSETLIFELSSEFFQSSEFSRFLNLIQEKPYELLYEFSKRLIIITNFRNFNFMSIDQILRKFVSFNKETIVSDENLWKSIIILAKIDRFQGYPLITRVFNELKENTSDFPKIIKFVNNNFNNLNKFSSNSIIKDCLDFFYFESHFSRNFRELMEILRKIILIDNESPENYAKDLFLDRCYAHSNDEIWYSDKVNYIKNLPKHYESDILFKIESISSFCFSPAKPVYYHNFQPMINVSEARSHLIYNPIDLKKNKKEFIEKLFSYLNHTNSSINYEVKNQFIHNFRIIITHRIKFQTIQKWLDSFHQSDFNIKFQLLSTLNKIIRFKKIQSGISPNKIKKIKEYVNNFIEKENFEFKLKYFLRLDILSGTFSNNNELDNYLKEQFKKIISNIIDKQIQDFHWIPILFLRNHINFQIFIELLIKEDPNHINFKKILEYIPKLPSISNIDFIYIYISNFWKTPSIQEKLINLVWNIPKIRSFLFVLLRLGRKFSIFQLNKIQELIILKLIDNRDVLDLIHHKDFSDLEENEAKIFLQPFITNNQPSLDENYQLYQFFNKNTNLICFFNTIIIDHLAIIDQYHFKGWNELTQKINKDNKDNQEMLIGKIFENLRKPAIYCPDAKSLSNFIYKFYKEESKIIVENINKIMDLNILNIRFRDFISPDLINSFLKKDFKSFLRCNSRKTLSWIGIIMKEEIYKHKEIPPFLRRIISIIEDDRFIIQIHDSKESLYTQLIHFLARSSSPHSYTDKLINIVQSWITDELSEIERNWIKLFIESLSEWHNQFN